jgi:hypothetical protein
LRDVQGLPRVVNRKVSVFRLFGDSNGNGKLDAEDLNLFQRGVARDPAARPFRLLFRPATLDDLRHRDAALGLPFLG